jgi:hypothetical protein
MQISFTARTVSRLAIVVIPVLAGMLTLAADSSAAETAPVAPAGMKCATAKRTVIKAGGTIRIVTRMVCEAK